MKARSRAVAGIVALAAVLAACGVSSDRTPRAIDPGNVPFQLLAPTAEATSTTMPSAFTAVSRLSVYLADADGKLVAVRRQVPSPATPAKAIEALLGGPTEAEGELLNTAITSGTRLLGITGPTDGLVTIGLSRHLLDVTGRQQILALAQVVYTATSLASVDRVLFKVDGTAREVPNGDGELTASPLGRTSYRDLIATA